VPFQLTAKMPTPLQWDARRDWQFNISMSRPVITLLRDHITLISDLAKDWNSGPQGDFLHFTPYDYQFQVTLMHYNVRLYVNDYNVVDHPNSTTENGMSRQSASQIDRACSQQSTAQPCSPCRAARCRLISRFPPSDSGRSLLRYHSSFRLPMSGSV
jgi:hypothetical protein